MGSGLISESKLARRIMLFLALAIGEPGKPIHTVADLLARQAQLVELLQIEPEFRAGAEPMAEPQRRVGRDRALSVDDSGHAVDRHFDLSRQLGGRDAELLE